MPNNQCETFEFIYKLCTSNVHSKLSFEPYLRVMTGNMRFNVRTDSEFFEVIPHASTTSGPLNELCTTSPRVRNFVFKLLVLNKRPRVHNFFPFQKLCIKGQHLCNFVPYFEILHHNPTCAYVRTFVRVVHLTPHVHNFVPFLGVVHAEQPM